MAVMPESRETGADPAVGAVFQWVPGSTDETAHYVR